MHGELHLTMECKARVNSRILCVHFTYTIAIFIEFLSKNGSKTNDKNVDLRVPSPRDFDHEYFESSARWKEILLHNIVILE